MFNAILQFGWVNVQHEILADNLTEDEALRLESEEIRLHSEASTMVYNIAQVSPQYLAQEAAHFIDAPAQNSPRSTEPSSTVPRYADHSVHKHHKKHIIPLTTKPIGVRQYPIDVYSTDGTYIATYPSAKIASHELHVNHGDIISCCKGVKADGKAKYQVKGYVFRYHIENPICSTVE